LPHNIVGHFTKLGLVLETQIQQKQKKHLK